MTGPDVDAGGGSPPVGIGLLGPVEVRVDGRPVGLGGPRPRALVSVLALSAGSAVPTGRLVDLIWEGDPPPTAVNIVQVYVSRLRRALTPPGRDPLLQKASGGYLLDVDPDAVDAHRFERWAAEGHALLAAGDPAGAAGLLARAVALWRGPALPDLAGLPAGEAVAARLEGLLVSARADLADAELALGRHALLVPALEEQVRLNPLDERPVGQLMVALYRSGRQADALAAYTAAAHRLDEELGVEPGPELRRLQGQVLRQDDVLLAPDPPPSVPSVPAAAPRPAPTGAPRSAPAAPTGATVPAQRSAEPVAAQAVPVLPGLRAATALVGRQAELATAVRLLTEDGARLVTLLGPGGMGKTRLALAVVEQLAASGREVVVVPLADVTDPADLLPEVCRAAGAVPDRPGEPAHEVAAHRFAGAPGRAGTVLLLDNLEQLVTASETSADALDGLVALLDAVPDLSVLATSRTALRLRGEHVLALDPLSLPEPGAAVLESEAVRLFRDRAAAALPGFEVDGANAPAVAALCRALDGLPLAIELAAARVRVLPPEQLLARMDDRLRLLTGGPRDLPERQRSIRATLDWSLQLLEPDEARTFAELAVFAGGWTVDAAEAVCGADVLDPLDRLVDRSLVVADGSGRMSMLGTVREYAVELLPGDDPVRARHAAYYAALAEDLGPRCRSSPDSTLRARLDVEAGNLAAALEFAAARAVRTGASSGSHGGSDGGELLARLVIGLLDYWFYAGRVHHADRWVRVASQADLPAWERARLLLSAGNLACVEGDLARAGTALAGAHDAAVELGDVVLLARTHAVRAMVDRHAGRPDEALARVEAALALVEHGPGEAGTGEGGRGEGRPGGDGPDGTPAGGLLASLRNERGELLDELDRTAEALPLLQGFAEWAAREGGDSRLAQARANLALQAQEAGDQALAEQLVGAALQAADRGDAAPLRADVLATAGLVALRAGQCARAAGLLRESARLNQSSGQLLSLADTVSLLGAALLDDDPVRAARLLGAGRAWRQARGMAVVGRVARRTVAEAERRLAGIAPAAGPPGGLAAEQEAGARVPYGSVAGLRFLGVLDPPEALQGKGSGAEVDLRAVVVPLPADPDVSRRR